MNHRTEHTNTERTTTNTRGYDSEHQRQAKACIRNQPWCTWCGSTHDLTADHIVTGKPHLGYQTLCRPCNSKRRHGSNGPTSS